MSGHEGGNATVLVYATFPTLAEAEQVGGALIEQRLAACVNILPGMTSIYRWQGVIETGAETVMIIKTRASLADPVIGEVRRRHSFSNPALLVLPVISGSAEFLGWIEQETGTPTAD